MAWSGQYVNLQHAKERLQWVIPFTLLLVLLLLYHCISAIRVRSCW